MAVKHYKIINRRYYNDFLPYLFYKYQRVFFESMIWRGRKLWAYNFMLKLRYELKLRESIEFHIIFILAMLNITPHIILSYLKIGGAKQGVPLAISWKKKITYAVKWVRMALTNKYKKIRIKFLLEEILLSIHNKGLGCKKKKRTYIEGYSNRFLLKRFKYKYKN